MIYGACFGMELTIDNIAALYFTDYFHLALTAAGFVAGSFGMMNLFARALGGIVSDRFHQRWGLRGRALLLGATICCEGLALMLFSQMRVLPLAIARDDADRTVHQDVERRDVFAGSVRQQARLGRGGRDRGRGRQRGFRAGRIPVQGQHAVDPGAAGSGRDDFRRFRAGLRGSLLGRRRTSRASGDRSAA